ncbi:MAG: Slp family lipoprotein [Nitrospirales bacterium]|nr:Slp family lipoprotein [Nitrospirales bacterium]
MRIMQGIALFVLLAISGCAHVISPDSRDAADRSLPSRAFFADPDAYRGKVVILGGTVITTTTTKEGTFIEVLEQPLDSRERPGNGRDASLGRFIAFYPAYLDPAVYTQGKLVTVAGEVMGSKTGLIGEMEYRYPLVRSREIHLFRPSGPSPVHLGIGIGIGIGGSF